ncbi:MAG TPA: hypothetical protein VHO50_02135 [Bacteroidales bacterium]|nr:hypothetical protein [Bacteroidales bacterium]
MIRVLGIKIIDRIKESGLTQGILSRNASVITTRLGFHEVTDSVCSREAYIVLHLNDDSKGSDKLINELKALEGIEIGELKFETTDAANHNVSSDKGAEILCLLTQRDPEVISLVQKTLTSYGCNIRTRLGVNETFFGKPAGLIILELTGNNDQRILLEKDLRNIGNLHVEAMRF